MTKDRCEPFTVGVLRDLQSLEQMLSAGMFEETARRIGAEQEMFLFDSATALSRSFTVRTG